MEEIDKSELAELHGGTKNERILEKNRKAVFVSPAGAGSGAQPDACGDGGGL